MYVQTFNVKYIYFVESAAIALCEAAGGIAIRISFNNSPLEIN